MKLALLLVYIPEGAMTSLLHKHWTEKRMLASAHQTFDEFADCQPVDFPTEWKGKD